jgi:hypothetical protein
LRAFALVREEGYTHAGPAGAPVPSIDSRIAALEAALLKLVQLQGHLEFY